MDERKRRSKGKDSREKGRVIREGQHPSSRAATHSRTPSTP